jgi:hypothetical protein
MADLNNKRPVTDRLLIPISFLILLGMLAFLFTRKDTDDVLSSIPFSPFQKSSLSPTPSADVCANSSCPAGILNLTPWKLTLPIETSPGSRKPLEIRQPELATYGRAPWFMPTPDKKGVIFRAPVNAPTTSDSDYPRSELREMSSDGKNEAVWPSIKGVHTLFLDEAITAVPKTKPHVVAGQIHGDDDDLLVIRLEHPVLYIARGKQNVSTLDEQYALGRRFTIKFVARDGKISVYYNGSVAPVYELEKKLNQAYFKAGVYTQSNCDMEGSPSLCAADNYGEVVIYRSIITHE